jgi:hypothetical protein
MLEKFLKPLSQELGIKDYAPTDQNQYELAFIQGNVTISQLEQKILLKGIIGECPKVDSESFILKIMEANLFGIGTRGAAIGLKENENLLTLSLALDYNSSYKEFKEKLEDFISVMTYWQTVASNTEEREIV